MAFIDQNSDIQSLIKSITGLITLEFNRCMPDSIIVLHAEIHLVGWLFLDGSLSASSCDNKVSLHFSMEAEVKWIWVQLFH